MLDFLNNQNIEKPHRIRLIRDFSLFHAAMLHRVGRGIRTLDLQNHNLTR